MDGIQQTNFRVLTWSTVLKEPLLHFLVLAGLIFAADAIWSSAQKETIIVEKQTVDYLIRQREDLLLRELSEEEKNHAVESFIEDEILYNEAYERGLDQHDSRMRRNLIRKMKGLLRGEVREPTEEDLVQYFEQNRDRYTRSASLSLNQVFFPSTSHVPDNLLKQLQEGLDPNSVGEMSVKFGRSLSEYTNKELSTLLGPETAKMIVAIKDNQWHGPIESIYGVHFVRITQRLPQSRAGFDQVKSYIAGDWTVAQSRRVVDEEIRRLRADYQIIVEGGGLKH